MTWWKRDFKVIRDNMVSGGPAVLIAAALLPALAFAVPAQAGPQYPYRLVDLGTFGSPSSYLDEPAIPITSNGTVLGAADTTTPDTDWPHCAFCYDRYIQHALAWQNGLRTDLGALPGNDSSAIYELNGYGVGVGGSENGRTDPHTGGPAAVAVLFKNGKVISLGTLPGGAESFANWINDQGEVVGQSNLAGDQNAQPFLWQNGHMTELPTLGGGYGFASWINQPGDVTGGYLAPPQQQDFHGFLWHEGKMTDLPPVGGAPNAFGNAVNDQDQVVGNENDANGNEVIAALWSGGHGCDLNTLVAPNPLQMISADYITNQRDIFGHGILPNGDQRIFLLIRNPGAPLPPASTPARPLPAVTGPPDHNRSVVLTLHAAHRGPISVPTGKR